MDNHVRVILSSLIAASAIVEDCRKELMKAGFSKEETKDILQFYVYERATKEDF